MMKRSIPKENVTVTNIHAHDIRISKYMKQPLTNLKGEIGSDIIIIRDVNTLL